MQPILAESAPRRGRAIACAVVLAMFAALAATTRPPHPRFHHRHYELQKRIGKCAQGHYTGYVEFTH